MPAQKPAGAGDDADAQVVLGVELVERRGHAVGDAPLTALRASGRLIVMTRMPSRSSVRTGASLLFSDMGRTL